MPRDGVARIGLSPPESTSHQDKAPLASPQANLTQANLQLRAPLPGDSRLGQVCLFVFIYYFGLCVWEAA